MPPPRLKRELMPPWTLTRKRYVSLKYPSPFASMRPVGAKSSRVALGLAGQTSPRRTDDFATSRTSTMSSAGDGERAAVGDESDRVRAQLRHAADDRRSVAKTNHLDLRASRRRGWCTVLGRVPVAGRRRYRSRTTRAPSSARRMVASRAIERTDGFATHEPLRRGRSESGVTRGLALHVMKHRPRESRIGQRT